MPGGKPRLSGENSKKLWYNVPRLPGVNHRDAVRVFEKLGYWVARQSGHIIMTNGRTRLVIPRHNPIDAITMGNVAKAAGLSPDEFRNLL
jgi:predicted RNA binding protein YcfA (HicA-like mRNA interferase family)